MTRLAALLLVALAWAMPAAAQQAPAQLIADSVTVDRSGALVATGRVEVFQDGTRLTATAVRYDPEADRLDLTGPVRISGPDGTVILADGARLRPDLREGLVTGARLVIDRQLQLAAAELQQAGPRYTALSRVTASSCTVCADRPTPLWEIRADRVVHDRQERLIYFRNARFRLGGVPIAFLPALRVPGPGNDRVAGLLTPRVRNTSRLGTGVQLPYFLPLGRSADLTVTPYLATSTRTLNLRYRQAFRTGAVQLRFGASSDDLTEDTRGYLLGNARFALPRDFTLDGVLQAASDDAYLSDYGLSDADRLQTGINLFRTRRVDYAELRLTGYRSLRDSDGDSLPDRVATLAYDRRFTLAGGTLDARIDALAYERPPSAPFDRPGGDLDSIADGRDAARLSARLDWRREAAFRGLRAAPLLRLEGSAFQVRDDAVPYDTVRLSPTVGLDLRWTGRFAAPRATWLLQPRAQLLWTGGDALAPNEDSVRVELDAGNLFALDRFPGGDAVETGARANLGVTLTRQGPRSSATLTLGRVLRAEDPDLFPDGSGLAGESSDWLLELAVSGGRLSATGRALLDDRLEIARNETRLRYDGDRLALAGGFAYATGHTALDGSARPRIAELTLDAAYEVDVAWTTTAGLRWDFFADRAQEARFGLEWRGDCAELELTAERAFTTASALSPETRVGISFALTGFGDRPARRTARCGPGG